jgi:hypothetical protein
VEGGGGFAGGLIFAGWCFWNRWVEARPKNTAKRLRRKRHWIFCLEVMYFSIALQNVFDMDFPNFLNIIPELPLLRNAQKCNIINKNEVGR